MKLGSIYDSYIMPPEFSANIAKNYAKQKEKVVRLWRRTKDAVYLSLGVVWLYIITKSAPYQKKRPKFYTTVTTFLVVR